MDTTTATATVEVLECKRLDVPGTDRTFCSLTVRIGRRDYMICASPSAGYATVYAGQITRRTLGKTFWSREALVSHYKRDGEALGQLVDSL